MKSLFYAALLALGVGLVGQAKAQCLTSTTPNNDCSYGDAINSFTLNSISTVGNNGCSSGSGYSFFSSPVRTLTAGNSYSFSVNCGTSIWVEGFAMWIDLNNNGQYETSEQVYASSGTGNNFSGTITIPSNAAIANNIKMRTMCAWNATIASNAACTSFLGGGYGETEDYNINIVAPPPCSGTPAPGNTLSTLTTVCNNTTSFTLSLQNATTGTGVTYQWQSSANNSTWSNINLATSSTLTTTQSTNTYYRCQVTCSGNTGTSNSILISNSFLACYCAAANTSGCSFGDNITNVTFGTLNNTTGCVGAAPSYSNFSGSITAPNINIGSTNTTLSVSVGSGGTEYAAAWIDYNHNGTFDASEFINLGSRGTAGALTTNPTIPANALTGITRMRVRVRYGSAITSTNACTSFSWGETEDYDVNLVCPTATILTQPASTTICPGSNATFTVAPNTANSVMTYTYQWQESTNGGSTWSSLANGGIYSGVTTNTLTLTNPATSIAGQQYRCIVTNLCTNNVTSSAATLNFYTPPAVTTDPTNKIACPTGATTFSAAATNPGQAQWQLSTNGGSTWADISNGGNYSNATTTTLTVSGITNGMSGYLYRCKFSNPCVVISASASLTVNTIPAVTSNPISLTYCTGDNIVFNCSGTGTGVAYQWTVSTNGGVSFSNVANGGVYSGATTGTLNITGATPGMDGYRYRCVISGTCTPSVITSSATMTLGALPMVTTQPTNTTICTGTSKSVPLSATGYNITYQWQESTNGGGIWSNVTNGGVYSGATSNALTFTNATTGMTGYMYRCVVTNGCAQSTTSNAITLTVSNPAVVTLQPSNAMTCQGGTVQYTATGSSSGPIAYQWQGSMNGTIWNNLANTGAHSGVNTTTLTITGVAIPNTFKMYRCEMSTGCVPATVTNSVTLTINDAPSISANPVNKTICENGNTSFTVGANGTGITFQWQLSTNGGSTWNNVANGGVYSGATTFNLSLTNVPTSYNNYRYRCIVTGTCPSPLTSSAGILTVNTNVAITSNPTASTTFCSGGSTSFSVGSVGTGRTYKWYTYTGTGWAQVNNGGNYSGATTATLNITNMTATANTKTLLYYCSVTGTCNVQSSAVCTLTVHAKPAITANPVNITRCHGFGNIDFKVTANGTNITYQWQISTNGGSTWANLTNNSLYSGVNTNILSIDVATNPMNGYRYRCIVSGTCTPAVTSGAATLIVNPILQPQVSISTTNTDICAGNSVKFTATPTNGGSAPTYQWRKNNTPVATGSTYTTTTLAHGDIVTCHMTSNAPCATPAVVISNPITMKVTPYSTTTITISSDVGNSWCTGKPLEFTANITNGGDNPTYTWFVNGVDQMVNAPNLPLPSIAHNSTVKCEVVSSMKCFTPNPAVSNTITMTINQTTKSSIVIAPNPDSVICEKTEVTMFASFTNAGNTPKFQWMMNGVDIPGETMGTLKTTGIGNGDVINCRLISSNTCVFPEISNPVTFQVNNLLNPDVDLITTYNGNNSYTFTAVPTNGGSNPVFVWYRNFNPLPGVSGNTYTIGDLERWERIHVDMASNEPCIDPLLTTVSSKIVTTSVGELAENISDLTLHPNPNTGAFNISGKLDAKVAGKDVQIRITNALGQTVHTITQRAGNTQLNIPVTLGDNIANGVYTVNLSVDGKSANIRFVLNR